MTTFLRSASVLAFAAAAFAASAQVNPGFETGDFTGWTTTNAITGSDYTVSSGTPHTGTYSAIFGAVSGLPDTISQSIATVPGATYLVSYYLLNNAGNQPTNTQSFTTSFGTGSLTSGILPTTYSLLSFTGVATSASTTLTLGGYSTSAFYVVDDVSVVRVQSTPEPSAFAALGLGAVAVLRRRKRA